jgi:KUP system potassium uptake protein
MPDWFQPIGIVIATLAAVIAQALISGSFIDQWGNATEFWPKVKIKYPTELKDNIHSFHQLAALIGCVGIVLHFEESSNMEHAYGLAIILCMIMTTILLNFYLIMSKIIFYCAFNHYLFYRI